MNLSRFLLSNVIFSLVVYSSIASLDSSCGSTNRGKVPSVRLWNGVDMPMVAVGTCFRDCSKVDDDGVSGIASNPNFFGFLPERTHRALTLALEMGYSHIDTALVYRSQKAIGSVLASKFQSGELKRDDVFLTSKVYHGPMPGLTRRGTTLPIDDMSPEEVADAIEIQFEQVLEELGVGYVDLMLLHWPAVMDSRDADNAARRLAAWEVLEDMLSRGQTRAIGVSNFSEYHIEQLMQDGATVLPMVNQIEASVYIQWNDIQSYCQKKGIRLMAYSPLGLGKKSLLSDPTISSIAQTKGVYPSQVALRFLIQKGYAVLPMSSFKQRLALNLDLFSFELDTDEISILDKLALEMDEGIGLPSPYDMS